MDSFFTHFLRPMAIPCYIFMLTVPHRLRAIRSAGMPGRQHSSEWHPDELLKRILICTLIFGVLVNLFSGGSSGNVEGSSLVDDPLGNEEGRPEIIDSRSAPHDEQQPMAPEDAPGTYLMLVELASYGGALGLSFMQTARQMTDVWYS